MPEQRTSATRLFVYRGRLRWRVVGFDYLCPTCWRYSPGDIPWCGQSTCQSPSWWQIIRRWRIRRKG